MRVFSTFSGISAASAAWKPLGWEMVGYAEIDPFACHVLAHRYGATPPKYLPNPQGWAVEEDAYALMRMVAVVEKGTFPDRFKRHAPNYLKRDIFDESEFDPKKDAVKMEDVNFDTITTTERHRLMFAEMEREAELMVEERGRRGKLNREHRATPVPVGGTIPNFGDVWSITDDDLEALGQIDILEGGSPCQAFAAGGKGEGLVDWRSALMLGYLDLVERMIRINGLKWILWENVKGVLSNDEGRGFGYLLAAFAGCQGHTLVAPKSGPGRKSWGNAGRVLGPGGSVAWRILDSQFFGVAQHRERVFALASVGDGFESRDPSEILFDRCGDEGGAAPGVAAQEPAPGLPDRGIDDLIVYISGAGAKAGGIGASRTTSPTLKAVESGSSMIPTVAYCLMMDSKASWRKDQIGTLLAKAGDNTPVVAFQQGKKYVVRKLMPVECERLQGFEDDHTDIPFEPIEEKKITKNKDSLRCKGLGNSMSVPVIRWIGERMMAAA